MLLGSRPLLRNVGYRAVKWRERPHACSESDIKSDSRSTVGPLHLNADIRDFPRPVVQNETDPTQLSRHSAILGSHANCHRAKAERVRRMADLLTKEDDRAALHELAQELEDLATEMEIHAIEVVKRACPD